MWQCHYNCYAVSSASTDNRSWDVTLALRQNFVKQLRNRPLLTFHQQQQQQQRKVPLHSALRKVSKFSLFCPFFRASESSLGHLAWLRVFERTRFVASLSLSLSLSLGSLCFCWLPWRIAVPVNNRTKVEADPSGLDDGALGVHTGEYLLHPLQQEKHYKKTWLTAKSDWTQSRTG